jgi:hypothetical protein
MVHHLASMNGNVAQLTSSINDIVARLPRNGTYG